MSNRVDSNVQNKVGGCIQCAVRQISEAKGVVGFVKYYKLHATRVVHGHRKQPPFFDKSQVFSRYNNYRSATYFACSLHFSVFCVSFLFALCMIR